MPRSAGLAAHPPGLAELAVTDVPRLTDMHGHLMELICGERVVRAALEGGAAV